MKFSLALPQMGVQIGTGAWIPWPLEASNPLSRPPSLDQRFVLFMTTLTLWSVHLYELNYELTLSSLCKVGLNQLRCSE
jgi:hypothetical protein